MNHLAVSKPMLMNSTWNVRRIKWSPVEKFVEFRTLANPFIMISLEVIVTTNRIISRLYNLHTAIRFSLYQGGNYNTVRKNIANIYTLEDVNGACSNMISNLAKWKSQ